MIRASSVHTKLFETQLDSILLERPVESAGHATVERYIADSMESMGWTVERDEFTGMTTDGPKHFVNLIAHLHPERPRRTVLGTVERG